MGERSLHMTIRIARPDLIGDHVTYQIRSHINPKEKKMGTSLCVVPVGPLARAEPRQDGRALAHGRRRLSPLDQPTRLVRHEGPPHAQSERANQSDRPIGGVTTCHDVAAIRSPNLRECCNTEVQTLELRGYQR